MSSQGFRLATLPAYLPTGLSICLLSLFFLLSLNSLTRAEEPNTDFFSPDAPVELTSDRLDFDSSSKSYHAEGSVVITQEGTTIKADTATLNTATNTAIASGNIFMIDEGGNIVQATSLTFDIKEKTALIKEGRLFFKAVNVYITGDPINKTGPETYTADYITYTTCDCDEDNPEDVPDWSFSTTDAEVTIGEFLTGRHSYFKVRDIPIAYSPFLRVPIKRKRQTGFLKPRLGFSPLRGFIFENSLFWARTKNTDATFYLDIQSRRGVGKGAEYRYIRKTNSYGEAYIYHFNENDIDRVREFRAADGNLSRPMSAGNNRWQFRLRHTELFTRGFRLKADINIVSDDEYLLDFGTNNEDKSLESLESNISLSKNWSGYSLVVQLRVFDNLLLGDDSATFKRLPEVSFSSIGKRIHSTPFYISLSSSYINFTRKSGFTGHRLDARPKLSLPLRPGGYFDFTPYFTPRGTLYVVDGFAADQYFERFLYETGFDTTTTFVRIYRPNAKKLNAVKHTLRPKINYVFIPEVLQSANPQFDASDNITRTNRITYSLNSILTGKIVESGTTRYHEYLYLDISESYDINEATRVLVSSTDKRKPLSDVTTEVILRPTPWSTISSKTVFDVYDRWVENSDVELLLKGVNSTRVHFTYRYVKDTSRYLEANANLALSNRISVTYDKRFSLAENKSLEASYGITYKRQCWTAHLNYVRRLEDKAVYLYFDLLGIGKIAGFSGNIESE